MRALLDIDFSFLFHQACFCMKDKGFYKIDSACSIFKGLKYNV